MELKSIIDELGNQKDTFLTEIENEINKYISQRTWQECLTIVQRDSSGEIKSIYEPSIIDSEYINALITFLRKRQLNGYDLDSKITDNVVTIVTDKFESFYTSNADVFAKPLLDQLLNDKVFTTQLVNTFVDISQDEFPDAVKNQVIEKLIHILENSVNIDVSQIAVDTIPVLMKGILAGASTLPISQTLAVILLNHMLIFIKGAIAKIMTMTAVKTFIAVIVKKIIIANILMAIAAYVGSLGTIPAGFIFAVILVAFIRYHAKKIPEKMGEKVSIAVKEELSGKFNEINTTITEQVMQSLLKNTAGILAADIAREISLTQIIGEFQQTECGGLPRA